MNSRFIAAICVVAAVLVVLMYSAVQSSAKAVVTVSELLAEQQPRERIQLGARVASNSQILVKTQPKRTVSFSVIDIGQSAEQLEVVYDGSMPDTLKQGRDVILQGNFDGNRFIANNLVTQCPSKYEPPIPGVKKGNDYGAKLRPGLGGIRG